MFPGTVPLAGVVPSPQTVETTSRGRLRRPPTESSTPARTSAAGLLRPGLVPGGRAVLKVNNSELTVVTWGGPSRVGLTPACILAIHGRL
jgi:hypothetical protein